MLGIIRAMTGSGATRSHRVLRGLAVLSVVAMAFFAGMLVERLRLGAKREEMLRRYDQVLQQYRDQQMRSEKTMQRQPDGAGARDASPTSPGALSRARGG
jgi:hypothetical protein